MTDTAENAENGSVPDEVVTDRATERRTARVARRLRGFVARHGAGTEGQISYLGERGYRLVLVGQDGTLGDQVAPGRDILAGAAERAGVTLRDSFDGELAARVRTGPYEWSRMAGLGIGGASEANGQTAAGSSTKAA
ncbi:hypothetical protein SAMN06297387_101133 [Streptomyces zhaozhouensis]|uniref:Uncharacterized protein n=1 Tax=Streptomyces zhaozhouensis TaxID=1300267 RepID=A0A286DIE9_9ACTN|nr:hypothetical protein [Streptomyces zhaozhouensis]SOD58410.1 hypothetical protein SAMN06297387_101133 [Streptomyces zhaozhouensis]